jgi:hypothetical protein
VLLAGAVASGAFEEAVTSAEMGSGGFAAATGISFLPGAAVVEHKAALPLVMPCVSSHVAIVWRIVWKAKPFGAPCATSSRARRLPSSSGRSPLVKRTGSVGKR